MNRHGAALALAGWYLISPGPLAKSNGHGSSPVLVDVDKPLREWRIERPFDTIGKCQAYRNDWIIEQRTEAEKVSKPLPPELLLQANLRAHSRCVTSDEMQLPK
jgi:hypothetical protein